LIASGPSLTQADVDYCKNKARVIVINDNYKLAPWADVLYACDPMWWEWHNGVPGFEGCKITQDKKSAKKYYLDHIQSARKPGLSLHPSTIHTGANSGYQAINLAYHFGAKKIILLGYDMQIGKRSHWFGEHPNGVRSNYTDFLHHFKTIAAQLPALDLEIINCTRVTALNCFPTANLESVL
jgi:hypothetical protein